MTKYNPRWQRISKYIGIDTVVAKINAILFKLQKIETKSDLGASASKGTQILLSLKYQELAKQGITLPFADVEFRNYSQMGEDGILHYLFSLIGTNSKRCVEICAGIGSECNSANLILNHGWHGLLVDGNKNHVARGQAFFASHPDSKVVPPLFLLRWITRDSVNSIMDEAGFTGEIDLLSLDMDGVDYWIWEAINTVNPRVVVVEYQTEFGEQAITVPYRDDFSAQWVPLLNQEGTERNPNAGLRFNQYGGASLAAFNKLAKRKGYRLVGVNSLGHNAFFIRNDIGMDLLPEVSELSCHNEFYRERKLTPADELKDFEFVEV